MRQLRAGRKRALSDTKCFAAHQTIAWSEMIRFVAWTDACRLRDVINRHVSGDEETFIAPRRSRTYDDDYCSSSDGGNSFPDEVQA